MVGMEGTTVAAIVEKARNLTETEKSIKFLEQMQRHGATGEAEFFYFEDDESDMNLLAQMIGHEALEPSQIMGFYYSSMSHESLEILKFDMNFPDKPGVDELIQRIGNLGGMLEFPNNFKVRLAVLVDDETAMIYVYESDEQPNVCEECAGLEDYGPHGGSAEYSCEHMSDTIYVKVYATLMPRPDQGSLEDLLYMA